VARGEHVEDRVQFLFAAHGEKLVDLAEILFLLGKIPLHIVNRTSKNRTISSPADGLPEADAHGMI